MLKIKLTRAEAEDYIANTMTELNLADTKLEVNIDTNCSAKPSLSDVSVRAALSTLIYQAQLQTMARRGTVSDTIDMMRAIRTLTSCSLDEARDFVDTVIVGKNS